MFKKKKSVNAFRSHYPRRPEVFRRIYHGTRDPVCFSLSLFALCPSGGNKNMSVDNASCKSAPLSFPALRCVSPDLLADLPVFLFPQTSISKAVKVRAVSTSLLACGNPVSGSHLHVFKVRVWAEELLRISPVRGTVPRSTEQNKQQGPSGETPP